MTSARQPWAYRPEIDGLRALAVLAVLLSHLRIEWMGGGYVGVDMFFVISGYVVFGDLLRRPAMDRRETLAFYKRRVRRLLPNLIAMTIFVLGIGAILFLPADFGRLPGRIAASVLGFSNWLFAYQSGYFEPASEWNPLLHAWTLSVEFQFYLVAPLLALVAARGDAHRLRALALVVALASLCYALFSRDAGDPYHFYDTGARAWEFLIGVLLHLWRLPQATPRVANGLAALSLATLGACFILLRRDGAFPDARALLPTLSTALLLIVLPAAPLFKRMLEARPLAAIGQASYSIYIWHWPFIVFAAYAWPDFQHRPWIMGLLVPAIFLVSFAMHRWVEVPMRSRERVPDRRFCALIAIFAALLAVLCAGVVASRGWPARFSDRELAISTETLLTSPQRVECHRSALIKPLDKSCVLGANVPPSIAIWSDSHGVEIGATLAPHLSRHGKSAVLHSFSSCPPRKPALVQSPCDRFNRAALHRLVNQPGIEHVVLIAAMDNATHRNSPARLAETLEAARALSAAGKRLVLVYPVPEQPLHVPRAMVNEARHGIEHADTVTRTRDFLQRNRAVFAAYDSLGTAGVTRAYPHRALCGAERCDVTRGAKPLYFDDNHLTLHGARIVTEQALLPALVPALRPVMAAPAR